MRVMTEMSVICTVTEDYLGRDDIRVSLDGSEIGRFKINDGHVGDPGVKILRPGDPWPVHAGSRLVVEEVDLLDPNDVLLDHTFSADDVVLPVLGLQGQGAGTYQFACTFESLGERPLVEQMEEDERRAAQGEAPT
jgi:hypothetical protein